MIFTDARIQTLPERYRINLINALSGFKSANLIGTSSESGQLNLALFSSVFHVGANPPLIGMLSRPHSVPRHTLENIRQTGVYTINSVSYNMMTQAHHCSARSDRDESEFEFSGLTPVFNDDFKAPSVVESPLSISLRVNEITPLKANGTVMIVGEVVHISMPDEALGDDGYIDHEKLKTVCISGLDNYHLTSRIQRLPYAKK